jgi:hypothetical protein
VGNLFRFDATETLIQIAVNGHSRSQSQDFYIDFVDRIDPILEQSFHDIVEASNEDHEIVLVGKPVSGEDKFICKESRFRRSVLIEGHNTTDWLAAVVVLTWREGNRGSEPLLQVNTPKNSTREMGKASHVSGYINQRDHMALIGRRRQKPAGQFDFSTATATVAAARELREVGLLHPEPRSIGTVPFIYFDKENLFFYLFEQEVSRSHQFDDSVQMFSWSLEELLRLRRHHVYLNAIKLIETMMNQEQFVRAASIVEHNLLAQGDSDLSGEISSLAFGGRISPHLVTLLKSAVQQTVVFKYHGGTPVYVDGIAGLQYRAFFSHLLPAYAKFGVPGATELLHQIQADDRRRLSVKELGRLYCDETFMTSVPLEV